jgi:hypothetical protein
MNVISEHLETILNHYTKDSYYEEMKKAIEIFISKTGKMDEETDEYESRMNSFNDWFIFNYRKDDDTRIIDNYIVDHNVNDDLAKSFHNANYSLFLFKKINFRKQIVIKDILHDKKFVLAKDNRNLALVEDDLFIGRVVEYDGGHYLLNGLCSLPRDVYSILKKESKKIRKLNNDSQEEEFLLKLENLKTKSIQYGHLDATKIFQF